MLTRRVILAKCSENELLNIQSDKLLAGFRQ